MIKYTSILFIILLAILNGCEPKQEITPSTEIIRLNQLGYYPGSVKQFILVNTEASSFELTNKKGDAVFKGKLTTTGYWEASGENALMGDFSSFNIPGEYDILVDGKLQSHPFEIKEALYDEALKAAIKSYYFQRASMPIEEQYGGIYKRAAGHPDNHCPYHPSTGRTGGYLDSHGGWYDAGDYGKYIGNASLSTGQTCREIFRK
jgi:endoglucanase